jgi:hypothetical protein
MKPTLIIRVSADGAHAELRRGTSRLWAGEIPFAGPPELHDSVAQLLVDGSLPARPGLLRVEIEPPLVQVRTLRGLPPVSSAQLNALVSTQSSRFFRRNGKPLVTDALWLGRARRDRVAVAAAAEESWVDVFADAARTSGLSLEGVYPATLPSGVRLRLVSSAERKRIRRTYSHALKRLGLIAASIWGVAGVTLAARIHSARAAVDREMARLEAPVSAISRAAQGLDSASHMVQGVAQAQDLRARVLGTLTSISVALPDSGFVTAITVDAHGRGEITFVARRSSEVLAMLDGDPGLVSPRLEGGVARETLNGRAWERFTVSLGHGAGR